ncbi:Glycosyltransferase [Candidatus Hydrogenisulfobacillus filiaventi]|uniref:Glycosyltransferase n=1 Tax=Candidatus Hydrogenisulfobacillus filiaventi TaxID=2707344 RepID=A0A6F8ZD25_9FIRM|nr:Glycosyltransferase [Candidatus Hydrogenisulfobacillus filiaventi]
MKGQVAVLTSNHLEPSGARQVYGGAERYGVELTRLLLDLDYRVEWWQVGDNWKKEILPGVPIRGVPEQAVPYQTMPTLNQIFAEQAVDADYAIYFVTFLAYPTAFPRSLSISHGIYWDHPAGDKFHPTGPERAEWLRRLELAIGAVTRVVSVDTATINWVRATWPTLAGKFTYIPNFVDLKAFSPPVEERPGRPLRVAFPRRATSVRGINEAGKAALWLTAALPDLEVHFVGRAHDDAMERTLMAWAASHDRIFYYWLPPELMPELYRMADVVWIPSKSSEGTSLACLEAMASGCAVITTPVGGLSDLVQDGYSGLLIEPTAAALADATRRLQADPALRRRLGRHAREVAETFNLDRWRVAWSRVLEETFGGRVRERA